VRVTITQRGFDWNRGVFAPPEVVLTGVVDLGTARFEPLQSDSQAPGQ
jgi:hypothetical protein